MCIRDSYYNQENGYTVAVYETEDEIPEGKKEIGKQQFIAVGCELPRNEGLDISLKGQWKESERYGKPVSYTHLNGPDIWNHWKWILC